MFKNKLLVSISMLLLISCTRDSNTSGTMLHPVAEKMPYANIEAELLKIHDGEEYIDLFPESVQLLHYVLNDEAGLLQHTKPILLSSGENDTLLTTGAVDISSVNDSSLLILERSTNRLVQYNIDESRYHVIANQGRGPGDLHFSRELSVYDNKAFIGMQGFRISKFTCNSGLCEYSKTIQTEYNNYSVAPDDDYISIVGISAFGNEGDPDPSNTDQYLLHKINYNGEVLQSYLPIYRHRSPLVREAMNSGGRVRSFPESNSIVVTFSRFPYLYVHNDAGELTNIYELPDFIQSYYKSEEDRAGRYTTSLLFDNNSMISFTSTLNERWLLLRMREQRDLVFHGYGLEEGFTGTQWFSYFAFNVDEKTLYKIGEDTRKSVRDERRVLHVIDQGIVINENGLLYLLLNKT
ncbi:MAG: hypothetical protein EA391_00200 [Balneolaceae bacterium]|nr:MAG: hypothetical protein EA391_00200 [Balneolaceae bacterium]